MTSLLKSTKPISSANSSQVNIEPNEQPLVPRSMPSNQNQGNGNVTNKNQNDLFATPFDGKPPSNQGLWSKSAQEIARGKLSSPSVINNRKSLGIIFFPKYHILFYLTFLELFRIFSSNKMVYRIRSYRK